MAKQLFGEPHMKVTAERIGVLLRNRYPSEEYAMFYEVRDGTGFHASRSCDALVISLWPSRGLEMSGFEFKVSRQDWLKELTNPAKAEAIAAYCDRWWLVVSDLKIVHPGELPPTWGLMVADGDKLKVHTEAAKLAPISLDRLFVAAIARAAQNHSPGQEAVAAAVKGARDVWEKDKAKHEQWATKHKTDESERLKKAIAEFEERSGIHFSSYDAGRIGEAVKVVLNRNLMIAEDVKLAADRLERAAKALREIEGLRALTEPLIVEKA
jgi:hypothetical protein